MGGTARHGQVEIAKTIFFSFTFYRRFAIFSGVHRVVILSCAATHRRRATHTSRNTNETNDIMAFANHEEDTVKMIRLIAS